MLKTCEEFDEKKVEYVEKKAKPRLTLFYGHLKSYTDPSKNIYSDILNKSLHTLKDELKIQHEYERNLNLELSVYKKSNKRSRLKHTAFYNSRKKTEYSVEDRRISKGLTQYFQNEGAMPVTRSDVVRKIEELSKLRDTCVSWVAIEARLREMKALSDSLEAEEAYIDEKLFHLIRRQEFHYKVIARELQDTSRVMFKFEQKAKERLRLQNICKALSNQYSQLNVECVKAEEHFRTLMNHREFLNKIYMDEQIRSSQFPNLKQYLLTSSDETSDSIDNANPAKGKKKEKPHFSTQLSFLDDNKGQSNNGNIMNNNDSEDCLTNLDEIIKECEQRFSNMSNEMPFKKPEDLIRILEENEFRNLNLIENLHHEEAVMEKIKFSISSSRKDHEKKVSVVAAKKIIGEKEELKLIDKTKYLKTFIEKLDSHMDVKPFAKVFKFGKLINVGTVDNAIECLFEFIRPIFLLTVDDECIKTTAKDLLFMLKTIESKTDHYFLTLNGAERNTFLKAKYSMKQAKRSEALERRRQETKESMLRKIEKVMRKLNTKPKLPYGRKIVFRSKPPKMKVYRKRISENQKRMEEENKYFFNKEV